MNPLEPPPEQPMDDATRARIRARVVAATSAAPPIARRWLLPVAAAAAVLVIATVVWYAAFWSGDEAGPAISPTPTVPVEETDDPSSIPSEPSPPPSASVTTEPSQSAPQETPSNASGGDECADAVAEQLDDAEQVASWELPKGEAGIWVAGSRSVLCENSGGIATAHGARPASSEITRDSFGFSSSTYFMDRRQILTAFVAGGPLPEGVTGIDYEFPDGHLERAVVRTDDEGRRWWLMGYVPYDGPLSEPDRNVLDFDPVQVTVSLSGVQEQYTLEWGRDDCAQVNHGC